MRALGKIVATGALLATTLGVSIGSAIADPPPGVVPKLTDIVGVGSDTETPLFNTYTNPVGEQGFSPDYNAGLAATAPHLYSWNAVAPNGIVPSTIVPKAGCTAITRPNGSSAGIAALESSQMIGSSWCIDFARSSRKRASTDPSTIVFDAFAKDAITWTATNPALGGHAPAGASLTLAQLGQIYTCQANGSSYTWQQIFGGSASTDPIVPILPQNGSGTRSTFLSDIGVAAPGACVVNASGTQQIEENEGTNPVFFEANGTTPNPDVVFPYSVGEYIAQVDTKADTSQAPGDLLPQDLTNGTTHVFPITGTGASAHIASGLPATAYRLLYVVTRNASTTGGLAIPAYLVPIFGNVAQKGWVCTSATALNDIKFYGFLSLGAACGALS